MIHRFLELVKSFWENALTERQRIWISLGVDAVDCGSDLWLSATMINQTLTRGVVSTQQRSKVVFMLAAVGFMLAVVSTAMSVTLKLMKLRQLNKLENNTGTRSFALHGGASFSRGGSSTVVPSSPTATSLAASEYLYKEVLALKVKVSGKRASLISLLVEDVFFLLLNIVIIAESGAIEIVGAVAVATSIMGALLKCTMLISTSNSGRKS